MTALLALLALLVGCAFGVVVCLLKLPLPAPNALPGIAGIVGLYLGSLLVGWLR